MSPGATSDWVTILFAVDVPLVTKYVCRRAVRLGGQLLRFAQGPVGSSSESSPPHVAEVSAMNTSRP